jgi:hypothetical protein
MPGLSRATAFTDAATTPSGLPYRTSDPWGLSSVIERERVVRRQRWPLLRLIWPGIPGGPAASSFVSWLGISGARWTLGRLSRCRELTTDGTPPAPVWGPEARGRLPEVYTLEGIRHSPMGAMGSEA